MTRSGSSKNVKLPVTDLKMGNHHRLMPALLLPAALILSFIAAGCERKPEEPIKSELLVSTVWENTESCGLPSTEPGMYTCIFEPGGTCRTFYKAFETAAYPWRLTGENMLYINNIEHTITELTGDFLTLLAPGGSFWGIDFYCSNKYRSLPEINITTVGVSDLTRTSVTLVGYLRSCDEAVVSVEYGTSSGYGSNAINTGNPVQGVTNEVVKITVDGLLPETTYFYRFTAETSGGTIYGTGKRFRTCDATLLTDPDGNEYTTTTIGTQVWMTEPLRTTKYSDGSPIPLVTDSLEWVNPDSPGYCWYKNDPVTYEEMYGALYNGYTIGTGKLCPTGWHVPKEQEWIDLIDYLGAGAPDKLTEGHYDIKQLKPFLEASNETGFSAVQNVYRDNFGFSLYDCKFWLRTKLHQGYGVVLTVSNEFAGTYEVNEDIGLPVRCIKD